MQEVQVAIKDFENLYEVIMQVSAEYMNDAIYENRMVAGLLFTYDLEGIGDNPFRNFNINLLDEQYIKFKKWANREMQKMFDLIEFYVDDLMGDPDLQETHTEEEIKDIAAEYAVEGILAWPEQTADWVELQFNLKEDRFDHIQDLRDLENQMQKYADWEDWDDAFRRYKEEIPYRLVEEAFNV